VAVKQEVDGTFGADGELGRRSALAGRAADLSPTPTTSPIRVDGVADRFYRVVGVGDMLGGIVDRRRWHCWQVRLARKSPGDDPRRQPDRRHRPAAPSDASREVSAGSDKVFIPLFGGGVIAGDGLIGLRRV
jgi:hypothetical protein